MIPPVFKDIKPEFLELVGMKGVTWRGKELLVVTGANASGKSLVRRLFQVFVKKRGFEVIHLSQEGRDAGGFARVFVYGSEGDEATGVISAKTLVKGFRTSRNRDNEHLMIYDEPEIGMSEEAEMRGPHSSSETSLPTNRRTCSASL